MRLDRKTFLILLLAPVLPVLTSAEEKPAIYLAATETEELIAKDGQKVTVHGETTGSGKSSSGMNFVNFKGAEFYLVTFKSDLDQFEDGEPADLYDGKRIAVTAVISIYKEKPQIKLTSPDQVRILEEGEEFPPPATEETEAETKEAPKAEEKRDSPRETTEPEEPKRKPPVDAKKYFK